MTTVTSRKVWSARNGSRVSQDAARRIGEFLEEHFPDEELLVEPAEFVAAAKNSNIHDLLEWNNKKAAEQHRIWQAEHLLRSVTYYVQTNGDVSEPTRAMLRVVVWDEEREEATSGYMRSEVVWRTPEFREQQLEAARRELEAFKRKYAEFEAIVAAIEEHVLPLLVEEDK